MLSYQEFIEKMKEEVSAKLEPKDVLIKQDTVWKNNGVKKEVLMVKFPDMNFAPSIYLEPFYSWYLEGRDMETVVNKFMEILEEDEPAECVEKASDFLHNWDEVKNNLILCVVNGERNSHLKEKYVHKEVLDLLAVVRIVLDYGEEGMHSAIVTRAFLDAWSVSEDEVFSAAYSNMLGNFTLHPLPQVIAHLMEERGLEVPEELNLEADPPIFVLSNKWALYGASAMLFKGVLQDFLQVHPGGFYVLPSSIHEVVLLPKMGNDDTSDWLKLVRSTNEQALDSTDFLSDNIYFFSKDSDELVLVK